MWMRDYGPIFVRDKGDGLGCDEVEVQRLGEQVRRAETRQQSGLEIAEETGLRIIETEVRPRGRFHRHQRSWDLHHNRAVSPEQEPQPQLQKGEIEDLLESYLGFTNIIWLDRGIVGDDTDGHVDDIARFVDESTVVCMVEEDRRTRTTRRSRRT